MSRIQQHKKNALSSWRSNTHKARTALCSAVLARSDTVTMASSIPWPVSGHQRLDTCRCPPGASQQQKKNCPLKSLVFIREAPDSHRLCEVSRCRSNPLLLGVLALDPLAALLQLTLKFPLVVRRRCPAFLFDSLAMEKDFAEDVCQLVGTLCVFWESRIRRAHPVRTDPPFGWVSRRIFHIWRNRPTSVAEVSCLRNSFSHTISTSASPVVQGVSATKPLTNAANTDMNGCPSNVPSVLSL